MLMLDRLHMDTKVSGSGIAAIAQYTTLVHWLASFKYTSTALAVEQGMLAAESSSLWPPRLSISAHKLVLTSVLACRYDYCYRDDYEHNYGWCYTVRSLSRCLCIHMPECAFSGQLYSERLAAW
jgi:hypothetical protein